ELEKLSPESVERLDAFIIDTLAGLREETDHADAPQSDVAGQGLLGQLHAKMYVIEPHRTAGRARLIIGSANATEAAFRSNVEFCVEFEGRRQYLGIDALLEDDAPFRTLLERYTPV